MLGTCHPASHDARGRHIQKRRMALCNDCPWPNGCTNGPPATSPTKQPELDWYDKSFQAEYAAESPAAALSHSRTAAALFSEAAQRERETWKTHVSTICHCIAGDKHRARASVECAGAPYGPLRAEGAPRHCTTRHPTTRRPSHHFPNCEYSASCLGAYM
jgi:hypothetical protein